MALREAGVLGALFLICVLFPVKASLTKEAPPSMQTPPLFNFGRDHGDIQFTDSSDHKIDLPFNISYFGTSYKTLHISADGVLSFERQINYMENVKWWEGVRKSNIDLPFIAPYYHSGFPMHALESTEYQGEIFYKIFTPSNLSINDHYYSEKKSLANYLSSYLPDRVVNPPYHFEASLIIIVTWHNVAAKQLDSDKECTKNQPCPGATFQAVIAADRESTFVIFNYKEMNITFHETFVAGFNGGEGRGWYDVIPCHGKCGHSMNLSRTNELPNFKGSDYKGRFILNVGNDLIIRGGCLPDEIKAGMLEVYPLEVGMFGGEMLQVSGRCRPSSSKFYCKFGDDQLITEGIMVNVVKGNCPVPMMTKIGPVHVSWSFDRNNWSSDNIITVVLPEKVDLSTNIHKDIKEQWYSRDAKHITIPWDRTKFSSSSETKVHVKLLGYRETDSTVEYKELQHFGEVHNSDGRYELTVADHQCKSNCRDFEIGLFEISLPVELHVDAVERVAIRYGPFPLGWYVNYQLEEELGSDWSDTLCLEWRDRDSNHKEWLEDLLPCPCNLDQALADFGRFQPDPGCNLYTGSKCYYHTEAKHCVRSIVTTKDGAGNQCCYGNDGNLIYSQLSYQGSTPDRSHVWGAVPYGKPNLVPSLSHWKHDVVSYYYCCLWNANQLCYEYMELRPTTDCKKYEPPGIAFLRGDPHITTFDGQTYTFIGSGDYKMVELEKVVTILGRFSSRPNAKEIGIHSWKPKVLTSIYIQNENEKGGGERIEIHPAPERTNRPHGLDIRVGNTRKFFFNESTLWQDFEGYSIVNNALPGHTNRHDNFTVLLNNNIGVNVLGVNGLLHLMVALPSQLKSPKGLGLLGNFDDHTGNDYISYQGGAISPNADKAKLHEEFAKSWAVQKEHSLFPFPKDPEVFEEGSRYFEFKDLPDSPDGLSNSALSGVCGNNEHCMYDYKISGSREIAMSTLAANTLFSYVKSSIFKVENCGLPEVGKLAELNHYNFSVGHEIKITGCKENRNFIGGETMLKCVRERLDEAEKEDRNDYGDIKQDLKDNVKYITHWVPRPSEVCSAEESPDASLGLYIGIAVGAAVLLIIIIIIVVIVVKKRKTGKARTGKEKPTPASRVKREEVKDPEAAEAMLGEVNQRSPVYKPSKDAVRMSEVQGQAV
nr:sushi domain-containing protein 2-like [Biomphalaria glabrata]